MPYIKETMRGEIDPVDCEIQTPGELNYVITRLIFYYWMEKKNYQAINDIIGALEGAKLEFYRRVAVPYEDKKIVENGDVYYL